MAEHHPADVLLCSYGALQQPEVQLAAFGRHLVGEADVVEGHEVDWVTIRDPNVIATSGSDRHPVLIASDRPNAAVEGMVLAITSAELVAADDYEFADYARILVPLRSGKQAWVYALADAPAGRSGRSGRRPAK